MNALIDQDVALPELPILNELIRQLRTAQGKAQALTADALAERCINRGHSVSSRHVRQLIAGHYKTICHTVGKILVADAPVGYWLAESADELVAREALLHSLADAARCKHRLFVEMVRECGLGGILPDRTTKPEPTHVAATAAATESVPGTSQTNH